VLFHQAKDVAFSGGHWCWFLSLYKG